MMDIYFPPKPAIIIPEPKKLVFPGAPDFTVGVPFQNQKRSFDANFLLTPLAGFGANQRASLPLRSLASDGASRTTYTFTGLALTPADEYVFIIFMGHSGSNRTVVSASTAFNVSGAVAMTNLTSLAAAQVIGDAFIVKNPDLFSNTLADISVTYSGSLSRSAAAVWTVNGIDPVPHDTGNGRTNPFTVAMEVPDDGVGMAMAQDSNSTDPTITWTGFEEVRETEIGGTSARTTGSAELSSYFNGDVVATYSATTAGLMIAVSFPGRQ